LWLIKRKKKKKRKEKEIPKIHQKRMRIGYERLWVDQNYARKQKQKQLHNRTLRNPIIALLASNLLVSKMSFDQRTHRWFHRMPPPMNIHQQFFDSGTTLFYAWPTVRLYTGTTRDVRRPRRRRVTRGRGWRFPFVQKKLARTMAVLY
jgi:hypothetical protein